MSLAVNPEGLVSFGQTNGTHEAFNSSMVVIGDLHTSRITPASVQAETFLRFRP